MANLFQAIGNIKKYGFKDAIQGALNTPGGYLDATPSNPNVQMLERYEQRNGLSRDAQGSGSGLANTSQLSGNGLPQIGDTPATPPPPAPPANISRAATPRVAARPTPATTPQAGARPSLGLFQGKEYFDPSELYTDQLAYLDSVYGTNLSTMRQNKQRQVDTFGRQRSGLAQQLQELLSQYDEQEKQGLGELATYYGNLGDIYQSSQGVREGEFKGSVETARGKSRTQAQENESAIERALAEYLGEYDRSEQELARGYQGSRDEIGNRVLGDIDTRLGVRDLAASNVETDLTPAEIANNNALLGNLEGLRGSRFNNPFRTTGQPVNNAILEYLAGVVR